MKSYVKGMLARRPEAISVDRVFVRDVPLTELGLTILYILFAGVWFLIVDELFVWVMGEITHSPALHAVRVMNFVIATGLVLYLVLRRAFRTRRQAEEALRLSQHRFELVALATTDAVLDMNLETGVVWWGEGVYKLFGYGAGDVSSDSEWWRQRVHPEDLERVTKGIRGAVDSGGRTWAGEYRFRRQDGSYAVVLDRGFILYDAAGKPVRLVGGLSDVSERRVAEKALEGSRQQLRALTARLQSGIEEERARVAREIHDDLGQLLTALKINLDWMERHIGESKDNAVVDPMLERVVESGEVVENAIESVQRIAADLRPAVLDNLGLVEALREETRRFEARSGITCRLELPPDAVNLAPKGATGVFRVFQEALTNVARHANATVVSISLAAQGDQMVLRIEDNGEGIRPEALKDPRSLGLLGMAERAEALGGQLAVAPSGARGTLVTLHLPRTQDSPGYGSRA
jgi:two-component system sensor histidine kinase UhpB